MSIATNIVVRSDANAQITSCVQTSAERARFKKLRFPILAISMAIIALVCCTLYNKRNVKNLILGARAW